MLGDELTARQQPLDPLYESEVRFRRLAALSADIYWEQDEALRFTSFSTSRASHIEPSYTDRLLGKTRWQGGYLNMTDADWVAHRAVLQARQPFRDLELCRYDSHGCKVWFRVSGEPVFDAAGAFKGYQGIACDITERRRAEELRELEHAVTRILADADSASAALQTVIRAMCETEGWECGRYFRVDEQARRAALRRGLGHRRSRGSAFPRALARARLPARRGTERPRLAEGRDGLDQRRGERPALLQGRHEKDRLARDRHSRLVRLPHRLVRRTRSAC